jgi:hypothetical protein
MKCSPNHLLVTVSLFLALSPLTAVAKGLGAFGGHAAGQNQARFVPNQGSVFKKSQGSLGNVLKTQGPVVSIPATNGGMGKYNDKIGSVIKKQGPILGQTPVGPAGKYDSKIGDVIKKQGPIFGQTPTGGKGKYGDKLGDILKDPGPIFGGAGKGGAGTGGAGGGAPPMDPGKGSSNGGGHGNFPLPIPFPVGGYGGWGGYGGGNRGAVYSEPVSQAVYGPVAEVQTAAVSAPLDLELLEVRQLDRGTAEAGPAYRVTLRNKSGEAVNQAFHVVLAATISRQPSRDGAFADAEVNGMEAGRAISVDLRLPANALSLGQNSEGQPVPFSWLTALVDSHQELTQVTRENDYATLNRAEIAMVAQP